MCFYGFLNKTHIPWFLEVGIFAERPYPIGTETGNNQVSFLGIDKVARFLPEQDKTSHCVFEYLLLHLHSGNIFSTQVVVLLSQL